MAEPGHAILTSDADSMSFHMGAMPGIPREKLNLARELLEKMCPVHMEENLPGARWSKLLINAAFLGPGHRHRRHLRRRVRGKGHQGYRPGLHEGMHRRGPRRGPNLRPRAGQGYHQAVYYRSPLKKAFARLLLPIAMKKHRAIEPSMLQDLKKGKPCEVDAINGQVCQFGRKYGVPTPVNDRIVDVIKKEQRGELKPEHKNIEYFRDLK